VQCACAKAAKAAEAKSLAVASMEPHNALQPTHLPFYRMVLAVTWKHHHALHAAVEAAFEERMLQLPSTPAPAAHILSKAPSHSRFSSATVGISQLTGCEETALLRGGV